MATAPVEMGQLSASPCARGGHVAKTNWATASDVINRGALRTSRKVASSGSRRADAG